MLKIQQKNADIALVFLFIYNYYIETCGSQKELTACFIFCVIRTLKVRLKVITRSSHFYILYARGISAEVDRAIIFLNISLVIKENEKKIIYSYMTIQIN